MSSREIVIVGDSHIHAMGVPGLPGALRARSSDDVVLKTIEHPSQRFFALIGPWPRDDEYWGECDKASSGRIIALSWAGNQHHADFMFAPKPPLDFVYSKKPKLPIEDGAVLVPEALVRTHYDPTLSGIAPRLRRIAQNEDSKRVILGTPPPRGDNEKLRKHLFKEHYFELTATTLGISLADVPLSSPYLRLRCWHVIQDLMREIAEQNDAVFVGTPASLCDEDGFLQTRFWADDATHANAEFGRLFLDHVASQTGDI